MTEFRRLPLQSNLATSAYGYPTWNSNPYFTDFESVVSANWTSGAYNGNTRFRLQVVGDTGDDPVTPRYKQGVIPTLTNLPLRAIFHRALPL